MVRPKEWLLTMPRTVVEGGEDIFNEGYHSFGKCPTLYNFDANGASEPKA
jgi:hypothetical protein